MKLQVLVSTMDQYDYELLSKMNIQSDAIIINQSNTNNVDEFLYKGNKILFMSFNERGVGKSRNNALIRMDADICLMADDDMVYVDGYQDIVLNAFKKNPAADIILFNVPINKKNGETIIKIKKSRRIRFINSLKFGTVNIAFRKESILKNNIFFSLLFGGGARYGSGEDSIFITDALKKGLKIYSTTEVIAEIEENQSSWFNGFDKKYFYDRGALFQAIGGNIISVALIIQFLFRKKNLYSTYTSTYVAFKQMMKGREEYKK